MYIIMYYKTLSAEDNKVNNKSLKQKLGLTLKKNRYFPKENR